MLFTKENARQFAAMGFEARMRNLKDRRETVERLKSLEAKFDAVTVAKIALQTDFASRALARVRAQIDTVDQRLEEQLDAETLDAQVIDRLSAALLRLSEREFALAGRPKPAAMKVSQGQDKRPDLDH